MQQQTSIIKYVRNYNSKTKPIRGIMMAFNGGNHCYIGYSLCYKKDKFDKQRGFDITIGRGFKNFNNSELEVPPSIYFEFLDFVDRCRKVFKDKQFPAWTNNGDKYIIPMDYKKNKKTMTLEDLIAFKDMEINTDTEEEND